MSRLAVAVLFLATPIPIGILSAQEPEELGPKVRLRLAADTVQLRLFRALEPGGRLGVRVGSALFAQSWASETLKLVDASRKARRRRLFLTALRAVRPDTTGQRAPPVVARGPRTPVDTVPEGLADPLEEFYNIADVTLRLNARFELKVDRLKNERCTAADIANPVSGCQGGFPTPALDEQFRVDARGVIGNRFNVGVDFDSEREFSANNDIRVWYEGLEDEILRRVEVGNVTFVAPPSRFITAAIPANSFGIQTEAQLGAFDFRTIFAQQKGSFLRSRIYTVGETTTQPVDRELRDLDFEAGRFFTVVDPVLLPDYPAVDILNINAEAVSPEVRPVSVRIYRLRAQGARVEANVNLGGIDAIATRRDSPQRVGPFPWQLLVEGRDYYIDPSGIWFVMPQLVGNSDFLAVSYITASGDTIGTFPAVDAEEDTLELIHEPRRGSEVPTFRHELRNVYRVGGASINRRSVELTLVVNESEQPLQGGSTYLSLLGLARSNDPSTLDEANRVFPRAQDPNDGAPIRNLFLIFPNLQPFADSSRLAAGERNDSLYLTPTYLRASQGPPPRFRLRMHYETVGSGSRSQLNLGAIQIREGSEKIFVGNSELVRGRDYTINYELGELQFLNPDSLFSGPAQVRAEFEQNEIFGDQAPKSIIGLSTTYNLGSRGRIDAITLLQRERTALNRPQLGFEPQATLISGLSTQLRFQPNALTTFLNRLPLIETSVPSNLSINGEVAVSNPNPNRTGQAFIEEFEGSRNSRNITLLENFFHVGSRPQSTRGLPPSHIGSGGGFTFAEAVPLVWQNLIQVQGEALRFEPQNIDSTIVLVGTVPEPETVLWLTLKPDTIGGAPDSATGRPRWLRPRTPGPRWRSITQSLSGSGLGEDLSRIEFLEFWVLEDAPRSAKRQEAILLFDFGTVFEDAVAPAPATFRVVGGDTVFSGLQFVGRGRLDTEKDTLTNVFNAVRDDVGILGDVAPILVDVTTGEIREDFPLCVTATTVGFAVFPLGDLGSRCSRGNGLLDTEDLNGDNRLDVNVGTVQEDVFRYVFRVGDDRYFVRDGGSLSDPTGGTLKWRLYRIPFRSDTLQIGSPDVRQIRALRLTMVVPDQGSEEEELFIALARMRLVGAPWLKRAATPITGLGGRLGQPHGEVVASIVTTENRDLNYTPPPGVFNEAARRGAVFQIGTEQINESSLRLLARDLRSGERAEAFIRFSDEADKNFLKYKKLRVWARGRGPGWEDGDLEFFIKVGRDENNFYFYQAPARTVSWEPEVVVDINQWLLLRAQIESRLLRGDTVSGAAECGGDSTAYVACEGPYLVQVKGVRIPALPGFSGVPNPAVSPPNLAQVSEVAVGMFRLKESVFIDQAELWVDDIRLTDVVSGAGLAGAFDARLSAADVAQIDFSFSGKDDRFRQLNEDPTYVTNLTTRTSMNLRLDKLMPASWGMNIPFTVQRTNRKADPFFLNRTDVRADFLTALRRPRSSATVYQISMRRVGRGGSLMNRLLVDPVSLFARSQMADATTELSTSETSSRQFRLDYNVVTAERSIRAAPGFLLKVLDALPGWIRESSFGQSLRSARTRWNPHLVRLSSTWTNNRTTRFAFRVPVRLPSDSAIAPITSIVHTWRNDASVDLRPFSSFALLANYTSTRDLQNYGDSTTIGLLLQERRRGLLGTDVGFERLRTFTTSIAVRPVVSSWLEPSLSLASSFSFNRDPNRAAAVRLIGDSAGAFRLPETLSNSRRQQVRTNVNVGNLAGGIAGDSSLIATLLRAITATTVSYSVLRRSTFDQAPFDASFRYQLALGGVEAFREQAGVLATSAAETRTRSASGGVRLPLNLSGRLDYQDVSVTTWSRRGDSTQIEIVQESREWPRGRLDWRYTPRWALRRVISNISAGGQYRRRRQVTRQPGTVSFSAAGQAMDAAAADVLTENLSTTVSPSLTLNWTGGLTTALRLTKGTSDGVRSGNTTRSERTEWDGDLRFTFRTPRSLFNPPRSVRTTVNLKRSDVAVCLERAETEECIIVSDSRRRQFDIRLSTDFSQQLDAGASFAYVVTEQRHTSSRFSQIIFTIYARISITAGRIR